MSLNTKPFAGMRRQGEKLNAYFKMLAFSAAMLTLTVLLPNNLHANPNIEDSTPAKIAEIVVTAHRVPMPAQLVSSSVSIIDRSLIEARQSTYAADLLRNASGLAISRTGSFGSQTQVRMRGAEANHVLVIIDGIEANDPAGSDEFAFSGVTSYDLESIEIVRGPQSALWGSDAVAGIINITTSRAEEDTALDLFLEGGGFSTTAGGARWSTRSKGKAISFGGSHHKTGGSKTAETGTENDGNSNTTLSLNGMWQLTQNIEIGATARYTKTSTEFDDIDFFSTGLPVDADREAENQLMIFGAHGKISSGDGKWEQLLQVSLLDSKREQFIDQEKGESAYANKKAIRYKSEFDLTREPKNVLRKLILAASHEATGFKQRGEALPWGDPNQNQHLKTTGYALEYIDQPIKNLTLSTSIRYDDNSEFDNAATYRFTGNLALNDSGTRLRGSYGTAQKTPTFIERFGYFSDQFRGNPELKPEYSAGYEVGVSHATNRGNLQASITYFNSTLRDEINGFFFDPNLLTFTATNIDERSSRTGWEVQIAADPSEWSTLRINYTNTNSYQKDSAGAKLREVRRPKHVLNVNWDIQLPGDTAVNLNLYHVSKQRDLFFPPPGFSEQRVMLNSYTLIDLSISRQLSKQIRVFARAENLFDQNYTDVLGFSAPGRGLYAGMHMEI